MPGSMMEKISQFLDELMDDPAEERVVEYVVREVGNGRSLAETLKDPYVKNRLNEQRLEGVLENPEIIQALEQSIAAAFEKRDFGFTD